MNLIIELNNIKLENIIFLDIKENIIMEGNFTKIIYSNEFFVMNGFYIDLSLNNYFIEKIMNKDYFRFNTFSPNNINVIKEISNIEIQMLEYYKKTLNINNKMNCLLSRQMQCGNLKIFKEFSKNILETKNNEKKYILKISGIWENYNEIGITYKLLEI